MLTPLVQLDWADGYNEVRAGTICSILSWYSVANSKYVAILNNCDSTNIAIWYYNLLRYLFAFYNTWKWGYNQWQLYTAQIWHVKSTFFTNEIKLDNYLFKTLDLTAYESCKKRHHTMNTLEWLVHRHTHVNLENCVFFFFLLTLLFTVTNILNFSDNSDKAERAGRSITLSLSCWNQICFLHAAKMSIYPWQDDRISKKHSQKHTFVYKPKFTCNRVVWSNLWQSMWSSQPSHPVFSQRK